MYKVLIADDEWMIREGVKNLIPWEHYGFEVASLACNGKDALEKYKHHKPDLVIADIRMPQMDGLSLLKQIRTENEAVPFLLLSGHADFHYAQEAIGHGVDGYLLKPLEEDELIEHLQIVFHKLSNKENKRMSCASKVYGSSKNAFCSTCWQESRCRQVWTSPASVLLLHGIKYFWCTLGRETH